jgi:Putative Actinobacterial Holin-X, holin superfamily III
MDGSNGDRRSGLLDRTREEARYFWSDAVDIRSDLQELAAKEVELLGAEVREQVQHATQVAMWGGAAAIAGMIFLAFVFVTLMYGLAELMDLWVAALITTGVIGLIVSVLGFLAYSHIKQLTVVPQRTINSLKEDAEWARDLLKSSKR